MKFIIIICIAIFLLLFWHEKFTKAEIAKFYGIGKQTLYKWVQSFCSTSMYRRWKAKRKFDVLDTLHLLVRFGIPNGENCLSKGDLIKDCDTDYATLRGNIALNSEKLGFSLETYKFIDKFPPSVSRDIVGVMC